MTDVRSDLACASNCQVENSAEGHPVLIGPRASRWACEPAIGSLWALGRGLVANFTPDKANEPVVRLPHSTPKETLSVLAQRDRNMLWVVPLQFEAVALLRLGNGGGDFVCGAFSDEIECAFIRSHCVHGQRAAGVGDEHRPNAWDYHYRCRVGEGHFSTGRTCSARR